ncbi:MAG: sodium:solute symporter [Prevotella sp.]|nr:sodium:solute symporter [Prevotella sp.]
MWILATILIYFAVLFGISRLTGRRATNETFFRANRRSPWYMVAFGMIGASISGVTFVSVPGMVTSIDMTYMQTCLGFILGYIAVAFILLPLYYRLNLTTIYSYLGQRLGPRAYKTGASFFLLSKMTGAVVRFYVVCMILQRFVFEAWGIPFAVTVSVMVALIWLYTRQGGIKTLVWTDTFQTVCLFGALLLIIYKVTGLLGMTIPEAVDAIAADAHSRIFVFDDWVSKQNFWKQFLSGVFIVIVMTGLDQDMMQKNLTCKSLREAQKDMCTYGVAFVPANLLFLSLGVLLVMLAQSQGLPVAMGDALLPDFVQQSGLSVVLPFTIGLTAASFSSADSALTSLTTSYCVDIRGRAGDERLRKRAHLGISVLFVVMILLFRLLNSTSVIDAIYTLCGYTYGPLLGLFAFGMLTKRMPHDRFVPYICVASPLVCYAIDTLTWQWSGYRFGYELLMLNGLLTFLALTVSSRCTPSAEHRSAS